MDLDPCTALTANDLHGFGLRAAPEQHEVRAGDQFCGWTGGTKRLAVLVGTGSFADAERDLRLGGLLFAFLALGFIAVERIGAQRRAKREVRRGGGLERSIRKLEQDCRFRCRGRG